MNWKRLWRAFVCWATYNHRHKYNTTQKKNIFWDGNFILLSLRVSLIMSLRGPLSLKVGLCTLYISTIYNYIYQLFQEILNNCHSLVYHNTIYEYSLNKTMNTPRLLLSSPRPRNVHISQWRNNRKETWIIADKFWFGKHECNLVSRRFSAKINFN